MPTPVIKVEIWDITRLTAYELNARIIPKSAIDKVALSLQTFGWRQPLVADEHGVLIAGHTRLLAAKSLGLTQVPVHVAVGLSEDEARLYRLADNRTNQETFWDNPMLRDVLVDLSARPDFDHKRTGLTDSEFQAFSGIEVPGAEQVVPVSFQEFDDTLSTDCDCPHCGYKWKLGTATGTLKDMDASDGDDE